MELLHIILTLLGISVSISTYTIGAFFKLSNKLSFMESQITEMEKDTKRLEEKAGKFESALTQVAVVQEKLVHLERRLEERFNIMEKLITNISK